MAPTLCNSCGEEGGFSPSGWVTSALDFHLPLHAVALKPPKHPPPALALWGEGHPLPRPPAFAFTPASFCTKGRAGMRTLLSAPRERSGRCVVGREGHRQRAGPGLCGVSTASRAPATPVPPQSARAGPSGRCLLRPLPGKSQITDCASSEPQHVFIILPPRHSAGLARRTSGVPGGEGEAGGAMAVPAHPHPLAAALS